MKTPTLFSAFLLLCLQIACTNTSQTRLSEVDTLAKTCAYLWTQQHEDGSWRSQIHGVLKGGHVYTPFILQALLKVPDSIYQKSPQKIEKALDFIRQNVNEQGALGLSEKYVLEYPNYATAYALQVLNLRHDKKDRKLIQKMTHYLVQQQFTGQRKIDSAHRAYGGWGFGENGLSEGETGHVDVSHTRKVLQALRSVNWKGKETYQKAQKFLQMVQKHPRDSRPQPNQQHPDSLKIPYDGGFYYSPVITIANKARQTEKTGAYRSYATATCDGVLALLASGKTPQTPEVKAAQTWLSLHPSLDYPEGIDPNDVQEWHKTLTFYHWMVRAEAYQALHYTGDWRKKIYTILEKKQQKNGSFFNPHGARNKEDDPLLASAFAVVALQCILEK